MGPPTTMSRQDSSSRWPRSAKTATSTSHQKPSVSTRVPSMSRNTACRANRRRYGRGTRGRCWSSGTPPRGTRRPVAGGEPWRAPRGTDATGLRWIDQCTSAYAGRGRCDCGVAPRHHESAIPAGAGPGRREGARRARPGHVRREAVGAVRGVARPDRAGGARRMGAPPGSRHRRQGGRRDRGSPAPAAAAPPRPCAEGGRPALRRAAGGQRALKYWPPGGGSRWRPWTARGAAGTPPTGARRCARAPAGSRSWRGPPGRGRLRSRARSGRPGT